MEFKFMDSIYVSERHLQKMVNFMKQGLDTYDAMMVVAAEWDDEDYDRVGLIEEELLKVLEQRFNEEEK